MLMSPDIGRNSQKFEKMMIFVHFIVVLKSSGNSPQNAGNRISETLDPPDPSRGQTLPAFAGTPKAFYQFGYLLQYRSKLRTCALNCNLHFYEKRFAVGCMCMEI